MDLKVNDLEIINCFDVCSKYHFSSSRGFNCSLCSSQACFAKLPETYVFDRGGYSQSNIKKLKKLKVKNIGVDPAGNVKWQVSEKIAESIRRERAQVEGVIGVLKSSKYKFNKPYARSVRSMVTCARSQVQNLRNLSHLMAITIKFTYT